MGSASEAYNLIDQADLDQWNRLLEHLRNGLTEVFGEDEEQHPNLLIATQFGSIGDKEGTPECLVTSNLTICGAVDASEAIVRTVNEMHAEWHSQAALFDGVAGLVDEIIAPENAPPGAVEAAKALIAELGLPEDTEIEYHHVASIADVDDVAELAALDADVSEPEADSE